MKFLENTARKMMYEKHTAESHVSHAYETAYNYKILCWHEKTPMETYIEYDGMNRKCKEYTKIIDLQDFCGVNGFPRCDLRRCCKK